jgi:fatty acid desaturase
VHSHPSAFYVRQIKTRLETAISTPARSRLIWLPVHVSIIVVATFALARGWLPRPAFPVLSLAIGLAFGGLMFLGHETMHGAVLRGWAKSLVGVVCFAPLVLSPRLWSVWHNRMHHGNANRLGVDPDMYPSLDKYGASGVVRFATDHFAPGGGRWRGVFSLAVGFSVQSAEVLVSARKSVLISARDHRRAVVETALLAAFWIAIAFAIGLVPFVFAFVLPLVVANAVVMSFILTNHALSPANEVNDPLLGSLTVTVPRSLEWLTLGFGYHVEHHLFPAVSTRHAPAIRAALVELWPDRYQSMPIGTALTYLFRTGRVYRDSSTLVDPRTGGEWPTLAPTSAFRPSEAIDEPERALAMTASTSDA